METIIWDEPLEERQKRFALEKVVERLIKSVKEEFAIEEKQEKFRSSHYYEAIHF